MLSTLARTPTPFLSRGRGANSSERRRGEDAEKVSKNICVYVLSTPTRKMISKLRTALQRARKFALGGAREQRDADLELRITGTFWGHIGLEFFSNSAHFPIANVFLELLREGAADYLRAPDLYVILAASSVQAYWLARWQTDARPRRFWGNLIGPALYTLIESLLEGARFFTAPHHWAYWGFALAMGALQAARPRLPRTLGDLTLLLENVVRTGILLAMYWIFEGSAHAEFATASGFLSDSSHVFIVLTILFLGLAIGLSNLLAQTYLALLRQTAAQLRTYSEWLLGRHLLGRAVADPGVLALTRRHRAMLFMDIRGFTHWSEARGPEAVVDMLNDYYSLAEQIVRAHEAIRVKLTADEVMAVLPTAAAAVAAALELRERVGPALAVYGLAAGVGIHYGPVVEGVMGSKTVKYYDVIGDTVNTAKRLESAAGNNEVLLSEAALLAHGKPLHLGTYRHVDARGKDAPLGVYPLLGIGGQPLPQQQAQHS